MHLPIYHRDGGVRLIPKNQGCVIKSNLVSFDVCITKDKKKQNVWIHIIKVDEKPRSYFERSHAEQVVRYLDLRVYLGLSSQDMSAAIDHF